MRDWPAAAESTRFLTEKHAYRITILNMETTEDNCSVHNHSSVFYRSGLVYFFSS